MVPKTIKPGVIKSPKGIDQSGYYGKYGQVGNNYRNKDIFWFLCFMQFVFGNNQRYEYPYKTEKTGKKGNKWADKSLLLPV